ncbi:MAG: M15 family metallopeptidase [Desulfovibrio sp.]|nr:M15 family metallopeptidase [Desulfovibrio sp.]
MLLRRRLVQRVGKLLWLIGLIWLFCDVQDLYAYRIPLPSEGQIWPYAGQPGFHPDDELNLRCLVQSYPQIQGLEQTDTGLWLILADGRRVLYAGASSGERDYLDVDVRTSMEQIYRCEPERPDTPVGYAPGRRRSYGLLMALYGENAYEVARRLTTIQALGQNWAFAPQAARAFLRASAVLKEIVLRKPELSSWLTSSGTFSWRRIAGERVLSAHSFGIAFDIGVERGATYWRWSSLRTHPLQQSFSPEIVRSFEEEGFIWGGKWHEFDLMHFEYRPELICKGKWRARQKRSAP